MKTKIVPVTFWPETADTLLLQNGLLQPPPVYAYTLTNGSGKVFTQAPVQMTRADWDAWPAGLGPDGDTNYQLDCICRTLGLTRA